MRSNDSTIKLPRRIEFTTYAECDALYRKRLQALRWIRSNPFARAMHFKMMRYFVKRLFTVVDFPGRSVEGAGCRQ